VNLIKSGWIYENALKIKDVLLEISLNDTLNKEKQQNSVKMKDNLNFG
jgi:hypothetical protein